MEEKNEIVPVNFKPKVSKKFIGPKSTQKVAEIRIRGMRITLFDGASLELSRELLKVVNNNVD